MQTTRTVSCQRVRIVVKHVGPAAGVSREQMRNLLFFDDKTMYLVAVVIRIGLEKHIEKNGTTI